MGKRKFIPGINRTSSIIGPRVFGGKKAYFSLLGGSSSFSPLALSPLFWWQPSRASTLFQNSDGTSAVSSNNDPVGYVADLSGNGRHLIQSDGLQKPTYKTSQLNGLPSVYFDGTDHVLSTFNLSAFSSITLFGVVRNESGKYFFKYGTGANSQSGSFTGGTGIVDGLNVTVNNYSISAGDGGFCFYRTTGSQTPVNTSYTFCQKVDFSKTNSERASLKINSASATLSSDLGSPSSSVSIGNHVFYVGGDVPNGTRAILHLFDFFAVAGLVSDENIAKVESYFRTRYGVG